MAVLVVIIIGRKCVLRLLKARREAGQVRYERVELDQSQHYSPEAATAEALAASDKDKAAPESDPGDNGPALSANVFRDWQSFLSLGVPGAFSLFFEWGSFELVAGIAGQLGYYSL